MLLLLNTTKTMDFDGQGSLKVETNEPELLHMTQKLAAQVAKLKIRQLAELMSLSDSLATQTHEKFSLWGTPGQPKVPALFAFTGLIFKHLDSASFSEKDFSFVRDNIRILSGLYGLLAPFDLIEAYRLEMGCRLPVDGASNLAAFWKKING